MKTSDLIGPALDWAVAKCEGYTNLRADTDGALVINPPRKDYGPVYLYDQEFSTDWAQGGPIIEREKISTWWDKAGCWHAADKRWVEIDVDSEEFLDLPDTMIGPTPLIAAMRCYVSSKLGDEIEIPEELK